MNSQVAPLQSPLKAKQYKIGELSELTQVSRDTLRYYEKEGLLKASTRSAAGYRLYSESDLQSLYFVLSAKRVGFSLAEIVELLNIRINKQEKSCEDVKEFTQHKLLEVDAKILELQKIRSALNTLYENCCGGPESASQCSILQALDLQELNLDPENVENKELRSE